MKATKLKSARSRRRRLSTRRHIRQFGRSVRLSVHRTSKHIYAQVIDDEKGVTLCGIGTTAKGLSGELEGKSKTERAAVIGGAVARLAKEKGVDQVVFDRGPNKFHGRVKALADAARGEGLSF